MPVQLLAVQSLGVISVNIWSILVSLLNLLVMYLIVKKFLFKPIRAVLEKRNVEVQTVYDNAKEALDTANDKKAEYEAKLSEAEAEAETIIRAANEKAGRLHKELIDDANLKAEQAIRQAEEEIAFEKKKAHNEIKTEIAEVSIVLAEKLIGREINSSDHADMVSDFIENLPDSKR